MSSPLARVRRQAVSREALLVALTGLLAALPVIIAAVRAIDLGWMPSSDDGVIALRALDVLSAHPPLVGQFSQSSHLIAAPAYSLGPMLYWVLAVPARIGPAAIVAMMGVINTLAIIGIVGLAHRRGGRGFMFAVGAVLALALHSLPAEVPYEVWNCWAGVIPFTAVIFLAWCVACGDWKLLAPLIAVASYVMQCHLTYVVPALGCVGVALIGGAMHDRRRPRSLPAEARPRPGHRRWKLAALAVLVLCWIAPVLQQISHRPGNLTLAARLATSGHGTLGNRAGWWALARATALPPRWSRAAPSLRTDFLNVFGGPPATTEAAAVLMLAALVGAFAIALRRRRGDVAAGAALALVLCLSITVVGRSIPSGNLGLAASVYVLTWTSLAGMFVHLALGFAAWRLAPRLPGIHIRAPRLGTPVGWAVILAVSLVVADRPAVTSQSLPPRVGSFRSIRALTAAVVDRLDPRRATLLDVPDALGDGSLTLQSSLAYAMRRRGIRFGVPPRLATEMGDQYCPAASAYPDAVIIAEGRADPEAGTTVLARSPAVTVTLAQAPSAAHARHLALARREDDPEAPSRCAAALMTPAR